jgi:hypothetical protein
MRWVVAKACLGCGRRVWPWQSVGGLFRWSNAREHGSRYRAGWVHLRPSCLGKVG